MVQNVGSDVVFCLPEFDAAGLRQREKFPSLFDELDLNMEQLGVDSYGVSDTTLEEVSLVLNLMGSLNFTVFIFRFFCESLMILPPI